MLPARFDARALLGREVWEGISAALAGPISNSTAREMVVRLRFIIVSSHSIGAVQRRRMSGGA